MIKAVIFDYGGVISGDAVMSDDCAEIFSMPVDEAKELLKSPAEIFTKCSKGLIKEDEFWKGISAILGKPEPEGCAEKYREICSKNIKFSQEMLEFAKDLKSKGIKTAVLSNIFKFQADVVKSKGGYEAFGEIFLSCDAGTKKPELGFYLLAVNKLGVKPEECIFIDDKERNLLPAQNLGMKTVLAKNPPQIISDVLNIINSQNEK